MYMYIHFISVLMSIQRLIKMPSFYYSLKPDVNTVFGLFIPVECDL